MPEQHGPSRGLLSREHDDAGANRRRNKMSPKKGGNTEGDTERQGSARTGGRHWRSHWNRWAMLKIMPAGRVTSKPSGDAGGVTETTDPGGGTEDTWTGRQRYRRFLNWQATLQKRLITEKNTKKNNTHAKFSFDTMNKLGRKIRNTITKEYTIYVENS